MYLSVGNHGDPEGFVGSWDCECSPQKHHKWQR